ncbi:MAG: AAA family ATPase [Verrucomicrobiota bacterium]
MTITNNELDVKECYEGLLIYIARSSDVFQEAKQSHLQPDDFLATRVAGNYVYKAIAEVLLESDSPLPLAAFKLRLDGKIIPPTFKTSLDYLVACMYKEDFVPDNAQYYKAIIKPFIRRRREMKAIVEHSDQPDVLRDHLNLIQTQCSPKSELPPILKVGEMLNRPINQRRTIIEGLLRVKDKMTVGGMSKSYKSWNLLGLAISASRGVPWLGLDTHQTKTLYLNFELHDDTCQDRIERITRAMGVQIDPGDEFLSVWPLRSYVASYDILLPKITEYIRTEGFELIIFDPLVKLMGDLNENAAGDINKLMNGFEALASQSRCAIVMAAHHGKGNTANKENIDKVRGSSVLASDPDAILNLSTYKDRENCYTVETTLRGFQPIKPFVVHLDFPLFKRLEYEDPIGFLKKAKNRVAVSLDDLATLLTTAPIEKSKWKALAVDRFDISEDTFYRRTKSIVGCELIGMTESGEFYAKNSQN